MSHSVIIVEDEFLIAEHVRHVLEDAGARVLGTAPDGDQALRLIAEEKPDLVVSDINLARGCDGIELARTLRQSFDIPVRFLSAYGDENTRRRIESAHGVGFVSKPFMPSDLARKVRSALGEVSGHA